MHLNSTLGRISQLVRARPSLWWPFVRGWLSRSRGVNVPCNLPQGRRLVWLPQRDFYGSYEYFAEAAHGRAELAYFLDKLQAGDVLYDIGGYRGVYSVAANSKLPGALKIHVFEPLPGNVQAIREICGLNPWANLKLVPMAVSDGGVLSGAVNTSDGMLRSGDRAAKDIVELECITLDAYLAKGEPAPTIIKLDVEGYELQVLAGADKCLRQHRPRLWIEVHPEYLQAQGQSHEKVLERLGQLGYQITFFQDRDYKTWEKSYHIWCVPAQAPAP